MEWINVLTLPPSSCTVEIEEDVDDIKPWVLQETVTFLFEKSIWRAFDLTRVPRIAIFPRHY